MQNQNKKHNQFLANRKTTFQFVFFLLITAGFVAFSANVQASGIDSYTNLILHMDDTGLTDSSSSNHTVTKYGDTVRSSAQSKFGGYSGYFDGSGDYLLVSETSSDFSFGTGDFTVDFWTYLPNTAAVSYLFNSYPISNNDDTATVFWNGAGVWRWDNYTGSGVAAFSDSSMSSNAWHHIAFVRNSGVFKMYRDGIQIGNQATFSDNANYQGFKIGTTASNYGYLNGYIDEFRISKGIARWTSNFTPPTSVYNDLSEKTLTNPTSEDIELDITAGYISVSGSATEATQATVNENYTLQSGSFQYTIPSNTTLTPSSGTMDITSLTVSDISSTIQQENPSSKGAIKIGIPNKSINFSQDITVTLSVSSTYNGKTLTIYSRPDNGETWTEETTCLVTDNQCSFTTDHATEYTGNYEVSNSPTPTDVNVGIDPTISLVCSDSVTLGTITGTGQSNLTTNEVTCTVGTINSSGYQLSWLASTAYMENENGDQISAYTPQTPATPETWSVASTESAWGGRIKSTSTDPDITGSEIWDSSDSYSGTWLNIATSPFVVANRTTETAQAGSNETILFGAEIGSNKFQPTGTYDVDVTFTATTL